MEDVNYLKLEFPEFITHIPITTNNWIKIGYNKIHTGLHFSARASLVASMHGFLENYIPDNLKMKTPVSTKLTIYAPINFGSMKMVKIEKGRRKVQWSKATISYKPNWDIGNLAAIWLKCLDDVIVKKGIIPDDTIEFLKKTTYEFVEVEDLKERKLVYQIKTITNDGI